MRTEDFGFDIPIDRDTYGSAKWNRRTDAEKAAHVVPLSVADMEFQAPPAVRAAVERAARHGVYGYAEADDAYFDAVVGWMKNRHNWAVERDWIVPENGVVPAMCVAVRAFTRPGDSVLIQSPTYPPFTMAAELNGREPVYSALQQGEDGLWHMDIDDLRKKAADSRARLLFLCSPHNPVGRLWTEKELRAVADICRQHEIVVVSDEIHADLALHGKHTVFSQAAPEMASRCVICTAPSKTFNLAGMQVANMIIQDDAMRDAYCARMNADGYSNVSYFGYHATIAAYNEGAPWLNAAIDYIRGNFDFFGKWLEEKLPMVKLTPVQGTYLAWTDWRALGMDEDALMSFVREEAMVVPNPGTMFGAGYGGFLRFNLAVPRSTLEAALMRLEAAAKARGIV